MSSWLLIHIGREVRIARVRAGMTQREVGRAVRRTGSWISRIESGSVRRVALAELVVLAAAVGLKLYVNPFPAGRRPLDAPQLALIEAFNARLHPIWRRQIEKVMPIEGDLRAVDEYLQSESCTIAVEAITRLVEVNAQVRSARAKQRDLRADRLILLVKASHANRRMLREAGPLLVDNFPIGTGPALRALTRSVDPGGDCLILL